MDVLPGLLAVPTYHLPRYLDPTFPGCLRCTAHVRLRYPTVVLYLTYIYLTTHIHVATRVAPHVA